jgi:hypothetical protein
MIVRMVFDRIAATMINIKNHVQNRLADLFGFFRVIWASPLPLSLVVSMILFSFQLFFIKPFFLTNDDVFKILAVKGIGAVSSPSPYMGYSNVLLGYSLVKMYSWFPSFPWYPWFLCLTQLLSFWAFLWLLCLKSSGRFRVLFFIGTWIGIYFIFFVFLQFTMTAGLAAGAGILLFCLAPEGFGDIRRAGLVAVSVLLLVLGFLIRDHFVFLMFLVALPVLVFRARDVRFRNFVVRNWPWPAGALLICLALGAFHYAWFQKDPAWREYNRFDRQRVELQDYRITEYNPATKPFFDRAGWSENDYWLFKNWFFANPLKYNEQNLEKLKETFPRTGTKGKIASFKAFGNFSVRFGTSESFFFF